MAHLGAMRTPIPSLRAPRYAVLYVLAVAGGLLFAILTYQPPPVAASAAPVGFAPTAAAVPVPAAAPVATPTVRPKPRRYFRNCAAARRAGAAPLHLGQPGYRFGLDADGDGVACEPYPRR
jgi:hypothetical protein